MRYTIGKYGHITPEEARKIARDKLYLMSLGMNPNEQEQGNRAKTMTLDMLLESYLSARKNLKPRTQEDYRYIFKRYLSEWRGRIITDITKEMIGSRHAQIALLNGPYTANKVMRVLRALLNYAEATFDIEQRNPVTYLTHVKGWYKEKRRRTYIKPHDLKDWWRAVHALENDTYRDFLLLLLFTGLRRSEAQRLRWSDIDFKEKSLLIPDTKNGDSLTLPLSTFLSALLEARRLRYGNYEYVFPGPGSTATWLNPRREYIKLRKNAVCVSLAMICGGHLSPLPKAWI
ncbi:MAG: tyrosine-type recombinase/integrase [Micavibrio sp.]|nr:tyrosine-type recombinase/integrase [Micavibrio sp.]